MQRVVPLVSIVAALTVAGESCPAVAADDAPPETATNSTADVRFTDETVTLQNSASQSIEPTSGSSGVITTGFNSTARWEAEGTAVTVSGDSYARWLGPESVTPSSIALTDRVWVSVLEFPQILALVGLGIRVVPDGPEHTESTTVSDAREVTHSVPGWRFDGLIYAVNESAVASFTFGSSTFVVATP